MYDENDVLAMAREDFIDDVDQQHLRSFMEGKRVVKDRIFGWAWQSQSGEWLFAREDGNSVRAAHAIAVYA